uniref:Large ribosomal subunit protein bL21m n=1 Tax=Cuerna arida TaxID=1464854 RepID=A0A1B6GY65_9HEMI
MMASCFIRCLHVRPVLNIARRTLLDGSVIPVASRIGGKVPLTENTNISWLQKAHLRTNVKDYGIPLKQEEVKDTRQEDNEYTKETIALVNNQLAQGEEGRLFAVIHVAGKQFIVTQEDIIIIHGPWPPTISDKIKFEKVMLVGSSDFTLIGRPVLPSELVSVTATVIDKDLSHVKTKFRFHKRKQFRRINFIRSPLTMIRINEVKVVGRVNERKDVEGLNQVFY